MPRHPDPLSATALAALLATSVGAEPAPSTARAPFDAGALGRRDGPLTVTAETLEYDYKSNVVVYRGGVVATQGAVALKSDTLTVTFTNGAAPGGGARPAQEADERAYRLHEVVAVGHVRVDHGSRWATGGRAVFDQSRRTLVLTEDPVLHDGVNEVAGDRVVVYLDEDRSVVEGGRKRVKAVLYPDRDGGLAPAGGPSP
jgi:lipopolysaccharide export system protein LptA